MRFANFARPNFTRRTLNAFHNVPLAIRLFCRYSSESLDSAAIQNRTTAFYDDFMGRLFCW